MGIVGLWLVDPIWVSAAFHSSFYFDTAGQQNNWPLLDYISLEWGECWRLHMAEIDSADFEKINNVGDIATYVGMTGTADDDTTYLGAFFKMAWLQLLGLE